MSGTHQPRGGSIMTLDPLAEYRKRNTAWLTFWNLCLFRTQVVSWLRLAVGLVFCGLLAFSFWRGEYSGWWFLFPVIVFVGLTLYHERLRREIKRAKRGVAFYERGIERIENRWQGSGNTGSSFVDDNHLYARDLDLFGPGSLYQLLCSAGTTSGEHTLARWLLTPASRAEILSRREAIQELTNKLDLREDLSILGTDVRSGLHPDFMSDWANAPSRLSFSFARVLAAGLVAAMLVTVVLWAFFDVSVVWLQYVLFVEAAFGLACRSRVLEVLGRIDEPVRELAVLGSALGRLEREQFSSERLRQLQNNFSTGRRRPSQDIGVLLKLVGYLNHRRNELLIWFTFPLLWATQFSFAIEAWRRRYGPSISTWLENFGEFEALCSLAAYAYEHPNDPFPEIVEGETVLEAQDVRHPLLPGESCVPNSVRLGGDLQLLLVSGSNMSGKSTLLRTVGINVVLAQAGAPVSSTKMRLCILNIGATIRVQDSLQAGVSRFYAEIQRLRSTMDLTSGSLPVLFLLDEILHGTNSHDRVIGAEAVIRGLIERGAIGLVTTHDLALARVADALAPRAMNVHFQDELENGRMTFDYILHPGVVQKSNALELMRAVGLSV